jgi:hypothetical protein
MPTTRRRFLNSVAGTGCAALGLADVSSLGGLAALAADDSQANPVAVRVRYGRDIEPIVRLIEDTPRSRCVAALIEQLRQGLPYRRFLAGVFFAGIRRRDSNHEVYKIQPVHQVSLEVRPEERLLPLFWAVDSFKQKQEDFPNPPLTELTGPMPAAEKAAAELASAFEGGDLDAGERAVVVLGRDLGPQQTFEQLWLYGCRNGLAGGHAAIVVASCFRALETLGWQHSEPVLRFVARDLFNLGGRGKPDRNHAPNLARVDRHLQQLQPGWMGSSGHPAAGATLELAELLRAGKTDDACELAIRQLRAGAGAQAVWDAVHLAAAELMVRGSSGWGIASRPLHSNTSASALHHAFRTSGSPRTRLLVLLQAVAWTGDKTASELRDGSLRPVAVATLPPPRAALPAGDGEAVAEVFALLPARHYEWDARARTAVTTYGVREDADEACRKVFALARDRPEAVPIFRQAAQSWMCRKASTDAHDYKFLAAMLEEAECVSPEWQPHLLAASVHFLHGDQSPDNSAARQAREALGSNG